MALGKVYSFEEGTAGNAIVAAGDYLQVVNTNKYIADGRIGALAHQSVNGGYMTLPTPSDVFTVSSYVKPIALTSGSARVQTATATDNTFIGMVRVHTSGVFDICDNTTTRQAASVATWAAGTWYRIDSQFGGSGLSRTIATKIFVVDSMVPIWDSGAIAVTSGTASAAARLRIGAQGIATGEVITDHVRFYDALEWPLPPWAQFGVPL